MNWTGLIGVPTCLVLAAGPLGAQARPDFSGIWRLDAAESRMIGAGSGAADDYQLTWTVDHRDPEISVVVNVRNPGGSYEYSFRCTTDGRECVNRLASLGEVRRMTAVWEGDVLVMSQRASTPHGGFEARDRLSLSDAGERLVFERIVTNQRGDLTVRQVFRKVGALGRTTRIPPGPSTPADPGRRPPGTDDHVDTPAPEASPTLTASSRRRS